jgi:sulfate transport system substrate-binding protein
VIVIALCLPLTLAFIASSAPGTAPDAIRLTLVAHATPRAAFRAIIPLFQARWLAQTGQTVQFLESYQASGTQSRAVAAGFAADVVALAVEPDVTRLVSAGLIHPDWQRRVPNDGFVSESVVMLVTRPGNPKAIADWGDLAREDVAVITPNPATSGGARWNLLAAWGAARRGFVAGFGGDHALLSLLIANIDVLDRDARESILMFERGVGDVAITSENEYYAGVQAGAPFEAVYPRSTLHIQNPIAVVDAYVDAHGTRAVAEAFVQFAFSQDAQRLFAGKGFRPVNPVTAADYGLREDAPTSDETVTVTLNTAVHFPPIDDLFTIAEFGGWEVAQPEHFGDDGDILRLIRTIKGAS